jgi:hypothetical protein
MKFLSLHILEAIVGSASVETTITARKILLNIAIKWDWIWTIHGEFHVNPRRDTEFSLGSKTDR